MRFGLTREQWDLVNETIVLPLKARGAAVYCYGSRARGDHRPFSDLDLMVESAAVKGLDLPSLSEKIQSSNFPYKVDLVHLNDFADAYRAGYERDKVLL